MPPAVHFRPHKASLWSLPELRNVLLIGGEELLDRKLLLGP